MKVRMIELFAGYGSQSLAMKRLVKEHPDVEFEPVAFAEIDKYAIKAYRALHGYDIPNLGDVSVVDWDSVPTCDLLTYSFPCTNISKAGKQAGLEEGSGTASSLLWECRKAIEALRPKYAVMENVANLMTPKHRVHLTRWCEEMEDLGYTNFYDILNAKDHGVPQNRKRVFMVSILNCKEQYHFPVPVKLTKSVNELLEEDVDEGLYLSGRRTEDFLKSVKGCNASSKAVLGWTRDSKGNIVDRHPVSVANCVTANRRDNTMNYVLEGGKVRRLSCRELYRIMDLDDSDIDILLCTDIPNTQHRKLAGNSIVVSCLYGIFENLFCAKEVGQTKLF